MLAWALKKVFGTSHERENPAPAAAGRGHQRPRAAHLASSATPSSRRKTPSSSRSSTTAPPLDDILPEAFAVCREAGKRVLKMRHYDVQLIGGMVLHKGSIAEMRTGEGKTLVATLPCYLNALEGKGVHVVTVNDYLAKRDAEWMGQLYNFLGHERGHRRPLAGRAREEGAPTAPTSPTARTTSSASTTCATT